MPPTIVCMTKDAATTHQPQLLLNGLPLLTEHGRFGDICIPYISNFINFLIISIYVINNKWISKQNQ